MTPAYTLSADAKDDLKEIWTYIADKGTVEAADRATERILSECEKVGENPSLGHFRDDLLDRRHKFWSIQTAMRVSRTQALPPQTPGVF